jgi:SSS family solute:Na+ symporter
MSPAIPFGLRLNPIISWLVCFLLAGCATTTTRTGTVDDAQRERARRELRRALQDEPNFVKVHAAEALLELDLREGVRGVFEAERARHETESPYRIGIWRVLARTADTPAERKSFTDKIVAAYADPNSPDADGAVETLAKLEYAMPAKDREALHQWTEAVPAARRSFGRWLLAVSGGDDDVRRLAELLSDPDPPTRGAAAYGLRFMAKRLPPDVVKRLADVADTARPDGPGAYLIGATFATTGEADRRTRCRERLIPLARTGTKAEKYEALNCFAQGGDAADVPVLVESMSDPEPDVRIGAARALLMIDRRLSGTSRN